MEDRTATAGQMEVQRMGLGSQNDAIDPTRSAARRALLIVAARRALLIVAAHAAFKHHLIRYRTMTWLVVGLALMIGGCTGQQGDQPNTEHPFVDPCPHPLTAPILRACTVSIAEVAGWSHNMEDQTRALDWMSVSPSEAQKRFGLESGAKGDVQLVLLDAWPRYSLRWYTPPPGVLAEPTASVQELAAVFMVPYTTTVQVQISPPLEGDRRSFIADIKPASLDW